MKHESGKLKKKKKKSKKAHVKEPHDIIDLCDDDDDEEIDNNENCKDVCKDIDGKNYCMISSFCFIEMILVTINFLQTNNNRY